MVIAKLCRCGYLPVEELRFDYEKNKMIFRFYCCRCGITGEIRNEKEEALESWNEVINNLKRKG